MGLQVAIAGASGYAGGELLRLVDAHPDLEVGTIAAHGQAGRPLHEVHPHLVTLGDRVLVPTTAESLSGADLVFLALPHGASAAIAAELGAEVKIVDLGADFRLADGATYERYYGTPHAGTWTYGLPELPGGRSAIAAATRIANTGCYAVATTLALAPLIAAGLAEPDDVVVTAASGTSGAGRSAKTQLLGSEVMGDLSPYKVGAHQQETENKHATGARSLSFTPFLAPMPRGILASVSARPARRGTTAADVREALCAAYDGEAFVHVLGEGRWPHTGAVYGSNSCHLAATVDIDSGRIVVVSAIDNLGKGAAGQAVQNANLVLGLDETAGLAIHGVAP